MIEHLHQFVEALRTFPKPVIAAVEGAAAGAGFGLALACDLIVAAEDARFILSYGRLGLSPDAGITWALAVAAAHAHAEDLAGRAGERADARAYRRGRLGRAEGTASAEALSVAARLGEMAQNALASAKELIAQAPSRTLHQQLAGERDHFIDNLFHANGDEGLQAFFDKRPPRFR